MKPSELRDKTNEELQELEVELRDKLIKLQVARATQRNANTAQFSIIKKDIARVKTIVHERARGLAGADAVADGVTEVAAESGDAGPTEQAAQTTEGEATS
ncbi:MAG: 50S ribosomal protein L29 [Myxococcota bacterium]